MAVVPVRAQVTVTVQDGQLHIQNAGYEAQVHGLGEAGGWQKEGATRPVTRGGGFSVNSTGGTGGDGEPGDGTIIIVGGYQTEDGGSSNGTGGDGEPGDDTIIIVGGYQDMLDYLRTVYGAVIERDELLGTDLIQLPGYEDPLQAFVDIITQDSLDGRPLIDYLRMMEVAATGHFGELLFPPLPESEPAGFPNDEHFGTDWGFAATDFGRAHWLPARALREVTVGLIDSGVRTSQQGHPGLDGLAVEHVDFAPSVDLQIPHGLGVATLLADAGNDGSGSVGLLGAWSGTECSKRTSYFASAPPRLQSYNVGDWGPSSLYVARAIRASVAAGAEVLNLSLRLPYSPTVHDAVREALDAGVVVVAAAGNYAANAAAKPASFPASIDGVIAVGAAEPARRGVALAPFSARDGVDVLAPGTDIVLGGPDGIWYGGTGTSYAAAYVTAVATMMKAADASLTSADVLRAIEKGARERASGIPFLDAARSLKKVLPPAARGRGGDESWSADCTSQGLVAGVLNGRAAAEAAPEALEETPTAFALTQNYPNPFNPTTRIGYELASAGHVTLSVYDVLGREVRRLVDGFQDAGSHTAVFDGSGLASGTYIYRLVAGDVVAERTMVLMK